MQVHNRHRLGLVNFDVFAQYALNYVADREIGSKDKRIGVFGPYGPYSRWEGEQVIDEVAKIIATKGFIAITAKGYYKPYQANTIINLDQLVFLLKQVYSYLSSSTRFWHLFPSMVSKAICNMHPSRTNFPELEGCIENNIPVLGLILRDDISIGELLDNCDYLKLGNAHSECVSPSISHCRFIRFCPFTTLPVSLPDSIREDFINRMPQYKLVAIRELSGLNDRLLDEFLQK